MELPNGSYETGGVKYLLYRNVGTGERGGTSSSSSATYNRDGSVNLTVFNGTPATTYQRYECEITWQVQNGRILQWKERG